MKKLFLTTIILSLSVLAMFGCSAGSKDNNKDIQEYNYSTTELLESIKEKMGESYLPNVEMDMIALSERFGIVAEDIEEFSAEEPMIGFHPDKAIIIKAKDGKAEKIEAALTEAKDKMINDAMQYPTNIHKTNAAKVIRHGNYVAFLLLGLPDEGSETEEAAAEFAENQVNVAVNAFNEFFK